MSITQHINDLHIAQLQRHGFRATFESTSKEGPSKSTCYDSLQALKESMNFALNEKGSDVVAAAMAEALACFVLSRAQPRRSYGDIVCVSDSLDDCRYLDGRKVHYRIDEMSDAQSCTACNNFECKSWPVLTRLSLDGDSLEHKLYGVSECEMSDAVHLPVVEETGALVEA